MKGENKYTLKEKSLWRASVFDRKTLSFLIDIELKT
jgi:hypothetical protein